MKLYLNAGVYKCKPDAVLLATGQWLTSQTISNQRFSKRSVLTATKHVLLYLFS